MEISRRLPIVVAAALLAACVSAGQSEQQTARADAPTSSRPLPSVMSATDEVCETSTSAETYGQRSGVDPNVVNGSAFDCGAIELEQITTLIVPSEAVVRRTDRTRVVVVRARKNLNFAGHTGGRPINPGTARENMGSAWKRTGRTVRIGTYGEFNTHIEGGAWIDLHLEVPRGLKVDRSADLSGPWSEAGALEYSERLAHGKWHAPTTPRMNWHAFDEVPDPTGAGRPESFWDGPPRGAPDSVRDAVSDCIDRVEESRDELSGRLVLDLVFDGDAQPDTVTKLTDTTGDPEFVDCVVERLGAIGSLSHDLEIL